VSKLAAFRRGYVTWSHDFSGKGSPPGQYIDTTRKEIDCPTTLPLTVGVEPWLMARWKARVEFLLSVTELLFLFFTVEALQGKTCQDSLLSGRGRSVRAKISQEGVIPGEYFLVSTKLDTFCYPTVQTARCYVPSF